MCGGLSRSDPPAIPICRLASGPDLDPAESNVACAPLSAETTRLEDLLCLRGGAPTGSVRGLGAGPFLRLERPLSWTFAICTRCRGARPSPASFCCRPGPVTRAPIGKVRCFLLLGLPQEQSVHYPS